MVFVGVHASEMKINQFLASLHAQVRVAMALAVDEAARVAALGGEPALACELRSGAGWALIDKRSFRIVRNNPADWPTRPYARILQADAMAESMRRGSAWQKADRSAEKAVKSLLEDDRAAMRQLIAMAPLIETIAYALAVSIAEYLDAMRAAVRREVGEARHENVLAQRYWRYAAMLGRATLVATTTGARAWLVGAARSFTWERWTPSFALVRERNPWLAAIAARAAAEAGPDVLPQYADALRRARHPVMAADAILGITAIGLRHEAARDRVLHLIEGTPPRGHEEGVVAPELFAFLAEQATDLLRRADDVVLAPVRPFRPAPFSVDPLSFDDAGNYPLLAQLGPALAAPHRSLSLAAGTRGLLPGRKDASAMFTRAWEPEADSGSASPYIQ